MLFVCYFGASAMGSCPFCFMKDWGWMMGEECIYIDCIEGGSPLACWEIDEGCPSVDDERHLLVIGAGSEIPAVWDDGIE